MGLKNFYPRVRNRVLAKTFHFWERLGFHVTPCHYYQPLPVVKELKPQLWERKSELRGVAMNEAAQLDFLRNVCSRYKPEYDQFGVQEAQGDTRYYVYNGSFGETDGDILYSVIRHFRPRKLIEIGSGWSTVLADHALKTNRRETGQPFELVAIEPYPPSFLRDESIELSQLIAEKVQDVDLSHFESLEENDILFIDSSHVAKIGSDVCWEIFEILPRLKKGVIVHFHDIFFPFEYPKSWITQNHFFWNEAYVLQAFMMYNQAFEIVCASNWMKTKHPDLFQSLFRSAAAQSFWIRKIA
jgi:Methyltransferase domain